MLETVIGIVGSAAGGTLFGTLANTVKSWQERKDREAQRKHELEMRKQDVAELQLEADLAIKRTEAEYAAKARLAQIDASAKVDVAEMETDAAMEIAATELQQAAFEHDKASYSKGTLKGLKGIFGGIARLLLVGVDVLRGSVRPVLTIYLTIVSTAIAWYLKDIVTGLEILPKEEAWPLFHHVITNLTFLTATAVTFWFGSRPSAQQTK